MTKEVEISVTVRLCGNCDDVHLVVETPDGEFDVGLDDAHWNWIFTKVFELQRKRDEATLPAVQAH